MIDYGVVFCAKCIPSTTLKRIYLDCASKNINTIQGRTLSQYNSKVSRIYQITKPEIHQHTVLMKPSIILFMLDIHIPIDNLNIVLCWYMRYDIASNPAQSPNGPGLPCHRSHQQQLIEAVRSDNGKQTRALHTSSNCIAVRKSVSTPCRGD